MAAGRGNLQHALDSLTTPCEDPDCEIHVPTCIEDQNTRLSCMAYYLAGAQLIADARVTTTPPDNYGGKIATMTELTQIALDLIHE